MGVFAVGDGAGEVVSMVEILFEGCGDEDGLEIAGVGDGIVDG